MRSQKCFVPVFLVPSVVLFSAGLFSETASADQPAIKFDVPALVCVSERIDPKLGLANMPDNHPSNEKVVEVVIPISTEVRANDRENVEEFRIDVYWNRNAYPMTDYGPRTQTTSEVEGLVSVETSDDRNAGLGFNLIGKTVGATGTAKAELSNRQGTTKRYQVVPDHEVLVASGSVQRGTGAFFRFHPSQRETLEGGRELILAYRVPKSWKGGVLKIECRATGSRKVFGAWKDTFDESRAFLVPVHLEGDELARRAAIEFVQSEQDLRGNWMRYESTRKKNPSLMATFATNPPLNELNLPEDWAHHLIQSGRDEYYQKYQDRLPTSLHSPATEFVEARKALFAMSR